jgi:hypothetical protein
LERILTIAMRTPDHGKIAPWRFVIVGQEQRQQLADLLAQALPEHDPEATPAHYAKALEFSHQAPVMILLISSPIEGHKIPVWEQQLSCGAVGMNLLQATHALGYVAAGSPGGRPIRPASREPSARRAKGLRGSYSSGRLKPRWRSGRALPWPTTSASGSRRPNKVIASKASNPDWNAASLLISR